MNEPAGGLFVKSRLVDAVDEAARDDGEDLVEEASSIAGSRSAETRSHPP